MKKKRLILLSVLLTLFLLQPLIIAADTTPTSPLGTGAEEVEQIQELIDKHNPVGEDGKFNASGFKPAKSKAEEKIETLNNNVNGWIENNAPWLRFIFHMKPEVSWPFFWNLFIIYLFAYTLISNGHIFLDITGKHARIFGIGIFIIFLVSGLYAGLARVITNWFAYLIKTLLPALGWWIAILVVLTVGLLFFSLGMLKSIRKTLLDYQKRKKTYKQQTTIDTAQQSMDSFVKEIKKTNK